MAAPRTFFQRAIDSCASRRSRRNTSAFLRRLAGGWTAAFVLICAGTPIAHATNFTCSWNDATANWTTVADWSNCNGTDPNNVGGNTYDVVISTGDPTLTTTITIGSVTINSPGVWSLSGSGAAATMTGTLTNSGTVALQNGASLTTTVGVGLSNTGVVGVDTSGGGGSSLTVGGAVTNSAGASFAIGNSLIGTSSTVQAASLSNAGTIELIGNHAGAGAVLTLAGGLSNTGFVGVDRRFGGNGGDGGWHAGQQRRQSHHRPDRA